MKKIYFSPAFSLVEILVAIAVLGLLVGVSGAAYQKAVGKASLVAEINAGKNLTQAYLVAATENGGRYLAAYDMTASGQTVLNEKGQPITFTLVKFRYPFRLAPYFNYQMEGTILVNRNESQIMRNIAPSGSMYDYGLSQYPALGINRYLVGGALKVKNGVPDLAYPNECIQTTGQADQSVILFISAGDKDFDGYEYVIPPGGPEGEWSSASWSLGANPKDYGNVAARFDGKAVAAFLDGSVKAMTMEELRDMRLWSRNAALANDPNYRPQ